jgi:hypothetical protein
MFSFPFLSIPPLSSPLCSNFAHFIPDSIIVRFASSGSARIRPGTLKPACHLFQILFRGLIQELRNHIRTPDSFSTSGQTLCKLPLSVFQLPSLSFPRPTRYIYEVDFGEIDIVFYNNKNICALRKLF